MRKLTMKGFLEEYIIELSGIHTSSVSKLIKVIPDNPRLLEPLAMYAVLTETSDRICQKNILFYEECIKVKKCDKHYSSISKNYEKVCNSYKYASSKKEREDNTKMLMRKRIQELQLKKGISTYRICKEINLNISNTSSFINNCECSRLNIDIVNDIWQYLESI